MAIVFFEELVVFEYFLLGNVVGVYYYSGRTVYMVPHPKFREWFAFDVIVWVVNFVYPAYEGL